MNTMITEKSVTNRHIPSLDATRAVYRDRLLKAIRGVAATDSGKYFVAPGVELFTTRAGKVAKLTEGMEVMLSDTFDSVTGAPSVRILERLCKSCQVVQYDNYEGARRL